MIKFKLECKFQDKASQLTVTTASVTVEVTQHPDCAVKYTQKTNVFDQQQLMFNSNSLCPEEASKCFKTEDGTNYARYSNLEKPNGGIRKIKNTRTVELCAEEC